MPILHQLTLLDRTIVRYSLREVGVMELPAGSNRGPKVSEYQEYDSLQGDGYAWCQSFENAIDTWAYRTVSGDEDAVWPVQSASVGFALAQAKKERAVILHPHPGCGVAFDWGTLTGPGKGDWPDHRGIYLGDTFDEAMRSSPEKWHYKIREAVAEQGKPGSGEFLSVEGNTSYGNDSNGGKVMIRRRKLSMVEAFTEPNALVDLPPVKPRVQFVVGVRGTKEARVVTLEDWREIRRLIRHNPVLGAVLFARRRRGDGSRAD